MPQHQRLQFTQQIDAPPEQVFQTMVGPETYKAWTTAFAEGSHYRGRWAAGERINFLAPNGDGMVSEIAEHRPPHFTSIRHLGFLHQGKEDFDSEAVRAWAPAYENYTLLAEGGGTRVVVDQEAGEDFKDYLLDAWPRALALLKALCEAPLARR